METVDPASFNDPVAIKTEWKPLKSGGTNFRTHILKQRHPARWEFRATLGAKLFCGLFFAIGIGVIGVAIFGKDGAPWFLLLFGLVFAGAGAAM